MFYHFGPVVVSLDQGISSPDHDMTEVVVHLLEDGFYQGFGMNMALHSLVFSLFMCYS